MDGEQTMYNYLIEHEKILSTKMLTNHNGDDATLLEKLKKMGSGFVHSPDARICTGSIEIIQPFIPNPKNCQPITYSICAEIDNNIRKRVVALDSYNDATIFNLK